MITRSPLLFRMLCVLSIWYAQIVCCPVAAADQPITLLRIIELALQYNESSKLAQLDVQTSQLNVKRALTGRQPSLDLSGGNTLRPLNGSGSAFNSINGALTLSQPLFTPSLHPQLEGADLLLQASTLSLSERRRLLAFDAARSFFSAIAKKRLLLAAEQRLERSQTNLKEVTARIASQLASLNDGTRVELDRSAAQQAVSAAKAALDNAMTELVLLTGVPVEGTMQAPTGQSAPLRLNREALSKEALDRRPDYLAARKILSGKIALAAEPERRFLPRVEAAAQGRASNRAIAGSDHQDATLALTLQWPLWDAGLRRIDQQLRAVEVNSQELELSALERRIRADVALAAASLTGAREILTSAESGVDAARRNADETKVLYNQGLAKAIELVDANLSRFEAEAGLTDAQLGLRQAELDLRAAIGLFPLDEVP